MAATDLNGDGFADLVTSANSVNTVYIFPSAGTAGVASVPYTSASTTLTGSSSNQFGSSVD